MEELVNGLQYFARCCRKAETATTDIMTEGYLPQRHSSGVVGSVYFVVQHFVGYRKHDMVNRFVLGNRLFWLTFVVKSRLDACEQFSIEV